MVALAACTSGVAFASCAHSLVALWPGLSVKFMACTSVLDLASAGKRSTVPDSRMPSAVSQAAMLRLPRAFETDVAHVRCETSQGPGNCPWVGRVIAHTQQRAQNGWRLMCVVCMSK